MTSWNKGLTKKTNESLRSTSEKHKGRKHTKEHVENHKKSLAKYFETEEFKRERVCEVCGRTCKSKGSYEEHVIYHEGYVHHRKGVSMEEEYGIEKTKELKKKVSSGTTKAMKRSRTRKKLLAKIKTRRSYKGEANPHYGKKASPRSGKGKFFFREDLQRWFRSTWEANYARILNYQGIEWKYEVKRFEIKSLGRTYLPDFYIISQDKFVEIKGRPDEDFDLLMGFIKEFNCNFEMVGPEEYYDLQKKYSKVIKGWEHG